MKQTEQLTAVYARAFLDRILLDPVPFRFFVGDTDVRDCFGPAMENNR